MKNIESAPNRPKSRKFSRLQFIESILKSKGNISTTFICQKFGISDQTARMDLATLEKQGLCRKTYGGAVTSPTQVQDTIVPFASNKATFASANRIIKNQVVSQYPELFQTAATIFLPGDSILLDLFESPDNVFPSNSVIYTNSILYARHHAQKSAYRVVLLPGEVDQAAAITGGAVLEDYLRTFAKISCALFTINYIDSEDMTVGFGSELYGRIAQHMIQQNKARHVIFITTPDTDDKQPSFHYLRVAPKSIDLLIQPAQDKRPAKSLANKWARRTISIQIGNFETNEASRV